VGFAFFRGPAPLTPPAAVALRERELSTDAVASPDLPADTDAKAQRLVAAVLRKGNSIERQNEMYLAIEAFTKEDFRRLVTDAGALEAMIEKLHGIEADTGRELASGMIAHWLAVDPDTIMTWAPHVLELIPVRDGARGILLDALAAKRPAELLALVPSHKDASERAEIISRALRELAAQDPAKARAWLDGFTDSADRRVAEKAFRLGTVQADPLRAVELAGSIESQDERGELLEAAAEIAAKIGPGVLRQLATTPMPPWMLASVLDKLAEHEPELAVELAVKSGAEDESGRDGMRTAFAALAQRDLSQALAKMEGLSGPQRLAAISSIGLVWSRRDPVAAVAWLMDLPVSERSDPRGWSRGSDDMLLVGFSFWVWSAPDSARAWADALPAGPTRDAVQIRLAQELAERGDAAEATKVLARMGRAADPKVVAEIARQWARRDPQAAADWAIAQPAGAAQSSALAGIVGSWANDDPRAVEEWLAQFPAGEARDRSVVTFLTRSSASDKGTADRMAEFDTWFDLIDDPWQRAQAATAIYWQRSQRDPAGARAWLSALPNVDAQVIRMALRGFSL
jgi:hypothetical protein